MLSASSWSVRMRPPIRSRASRTTTSNPLARRFEAAQRPEIPAPTTTTFFLALQLWVTLTFSILKVVLEWQFGRFVIKFGRPEFQKALKFERLIYFINNPSMSEVELRNDTIETLGQVCFWAGPLFSGPRFVTNDSHGSAVVDLLAFYGTSLPVTRQNSFAQCFTGQTMCHGPQKMYFMTTFVRW